MSSKVYDEDAKAIKSKVAQLFDDLSWTRKTAPDWGAFRNAFRADAILYPSARPSEQVALGVFIDRMEGQRIDGGLESIIEVPLAFDIRVFGNTALAYVSYEAEINGDSPGRGANAFLFVKDQGEWLIGAMAWDSESESAPLPNNLQPS